MPSPFPGMDPYLEDPVRFPGLHHAMITEIQRSLNKVLRPKYVARVEERVYISEEGDPGRRVFISDVKVIASKKRGRKSVNVGAEVAAPIAATTVFEAEVHDYFVEIRDTASRQIVTVIEILSPTNKRRRSDGRLAYLRKRRRLIRSSSHLVEIDLLRRGRTTFPRDSLPPHDYAVHVSRAKMRPEGSLWPIRLQQRLPVIGIPLSEADDDAPLDLQNVFQDAYDAGAYDLLVDYKSRPPLSDELAEWSRGLIKKSRRN